MLDEDYLLPSFEPADSDNELCSNVHSPRLLEILDVLYKRTTISSPQRFHPQKYFQKNVRVSCFFMSTPDISLEIIKCAGHELGGSSPRDRRKMSLVRYDWQPKHGKILAFITNFGTSEIT